MEQLIDLDNYIPSPDPNFADVPINHEFFKAVQAAVEYGLLETSSPPSMFRPYDQLTRSELTKFVSLAVDALTGFTPPTLSTYLDVPPNEWYFNHVEAVTALGLTQGYINQDGSPSGYFGPIDIASNCFLNEMLAHAELP
jgi:hypothetical protein